MQRGDQQVVGNHAASKKHRDNNKFHKKFVAQQVIFGEGIGEHDGHQHGYGCAADRVEECIAVGLEEVRVGEDLLVSVQIEAHRPERNLIVDDCFRAGERQRCHIHKGQETNQQRKDHDEVHNAVKNAVFCCFIVSTHFAAFLNTSSRPSIFY